VSACLGTQEEYAIAHERNIKNFGWKKSRVVSSQSSTGGGTGSRGGGYRTKPSPGGRCLPPPALPLLGRFHLSPFGFSSVEEVRAENPVLAVTTNARARALRSLGRMLRGVGRSCSEHSGDQVLIPNFDTSGVFTSLSPNASCARLLLHANT